MGTVYDNQLEMNMPFQGAKVALYLGDWIAVLLRDDKPGLPFPGYWDLPGGGRNGDETPVTCVLRETWEELGLAVDPAALCWGRPFRQGDQRQWFFVAKLSVQSAQKVKFGTEGQGWALMSQDCFLAHPKTLASHRERLQAFLGRAVPMKNPPLS